MHRLLLLITLILHGSGAFAQADSTYVNLLLEKATLLQRSNPDSCFLLSEQAIQISEDIQFEKGIRGACIRIGSVWLTKGQNKKAIPFIQRALKIDLKNKDFHHASGDQILMAYVFDGLGQQDSAFASLYEALHYSELEKDTSMQVIIYTTLGDLNYEFKRNQVSENSYLKAAKLANDIQSTERLVPIYMGLGNLKYRLQEFKKALVYYTLVDSISLKINDEVSRLQNLNNLALCYVELENYSLAIQYYYEALSGYESYSMSSEIGNIYFNLGNLYLKKKNLDSSLFFLEKAELANRQIENLNGVAKAFLGISNTLASQGKYELAYDYHQRYVSLSDSLMNAEKIASISEMKTKYETEKKEQEIELLSEQNKTKVRQRNWLIGGTSMLLLFSILLFSQRNRIRKERNTSDKLLLNILPLEVAKELKISGNSQARLYPNVSVLFVDFVNFTGISESMSPTELVAEIHHCFTAFDNIIEEQGLEKIKTIGDAYLAVCGLPNEDEEHAQKCVRAAQAILNYLETDITRFKVRVGINSGPVVAGIVGIKKYAYDIWGDTVNTAARMEQNGEPSKINISESTYEQIKEFFNCSYRGKIEAKNKGAINMYFVDNEVELLS